MNSIEELATSPTLSLGAVAYLAGHGTGSGEEQAVALPGGRLDVATSSRLSWPHTVVMASCFVGEVDIEPFEARYQRLLAEGS